MNIGIILIATGKYINFFDQVYKSYEKYFLPNYSKKYFLLTDCTDRKFDKNIKIYKIKKLGWPGDTLYRYHRFMTIKNDIEANSINVLYYTDVDMKVVSEVGDEILPKIGKPLVAVAHPGFFYKNKMGTPENRKESTAYIDPSEDRPHYICGGIQGGLTKDYLNASQTIKQQIDDDNKNNIIAIWNDESHWNRYMVSNLNKFKFLPANYCHPERTRRFGLGKLTPKILALDKNHDYFRN